MAKAHYLTDADGNKFYPYAHAGATFDNDGVTVQERLDELEKRTGAIGEIQIDGETQEIVDGVVNLPAYPASLSELTDDETHRTVTDAEKEKWNSSVDVPTALADLTDDATHRLVTDTEKAAWNAKSDFSGDYEDLTNKPEAVTENTVAGWGFTKNEGTYVKPETGIPASDIAEGVIPTTLPASDVYEWAKAENKPTYTAAEVGAMSADFTETDPTVPDHVKAISADDISAWNAKADASELTKYALVSEAGYDLGLSIDPTTYVMTLELKNKAGVVITTKTVDFPIESMVIGATYADGKITLELQNGQTLEVDISSIVGGLVNDTFTIAGIDMKDDITAAELKTALGVPTKVSELTNDSGYTTNTGTITGIKMNGASKGTSGVVDLGTVITEHQSLSGVVPTTRKVNDKALSADVTLGSSDIKHTNGKTVEAELSTVVHAGTSTVGSINDDPAVTRGDIVNNLTTNSFIQPLSAAQGKVLNERINTLTTATPSGTELTDIRVGANGTTYETAGDAVRSQVSQLSESITDIQNYLSNDSYDIPFMDESNLIQGFYTVSGLRTDGAYGKCKSTSDYIKITGNQQLYRFEISNFTNCCIQLCFYNDSKTATALSGMYPISNGYVMDFSTFASNSKYVRVIVQNRSTVSGGDYLDFDSNYTFEIKTRKSLRTHADSDCIVDVNGNGHYTSIRSAVENEPEGTVIHVREGIYVVDSNTFIDARTKSINLIGEDKRKCVIRTYDGRYAYPPIWCSCGHIANLTIQNVLSSASQQNNNTQIGGYAIHVEDEYGKGKSLLIENCDLYSDFSAPIGAGLRKDFTLEVNNCTIVSGNNGSRAKGNYGAMFFHDSVGEKGHSTIICKNNTIISKGEAVAMRIENTNAEGNSIDCTFIGNGLYSTHGLSNDNIIRLNNYQVASNIFDSRITKNGWCYNNTHTALNS